MEKLLTQDAVFEKVFENIQMQEQQRLKNAKRPKNHKKLKQNLKLTEKLNKKKKSFQLVMKMKVMTLMKKGYLK